MDENDRAQLIAMLVEHEGAAMGPAREAASRIPDDVISAAEQVQMLELNVREQQKQIQSRQEEIEKLHEALGIDTDEQEGQVEGRHEETENLDRAPSPLQQDEPPHGGCVARRVALSDTDDATPSTRFPNGGRGESSPPHRLRVGFGPVKGKATGQAGQVGLTIKALCSWTAQRVVEITFTEGELLTLLRKQNDEWWLAKLNNGQRGLVESRHFVVVDTQ
jgi:hypothetical protein